MKSHCGCGRALPNFLWLIQHFRFTAQVRRCDVRGAQPNQASYVRTALISTSAPVGLARIWIDFYLSGLAGLERCWRRGMAKDWLITSYDRFWVSLARVQIRGRNNTKQFPPSRSIQSILVPPRENLGPTPAIYLLLPTTTCLWPCGTFQGCLLGRCAIATISIHQPWLLFTKHCRGQKATKILKNFTVRRKKRKLGKNS